MPPPAPILALDTSTLRAAVVLGLVDGPPLIAPPDDRRHASGLLPAVRELLRLAGLSARDLVGLGVGLGPGSFTGLRVGLAAAKALAYAVGCPLVGLDSLEAIARGAPAGFTRIRVVADAQRGDLYTANFLRPDLESPPVRIAPTRIEPADAWLDSLTPGDLALGPALLRPALADALPAEFRPSRNDPDLDHPPPIPLLALTREALDAGRHDDPFTLEPHYIRRSAAEEKSH